MTKAIADLGRIPKALYLLPYIDHEVYRCQVLTQLNRHEGRHKLARVTFHGKRSEIRKKYREGQEDQLGVLWHTSYMDRAIGHLFGTTSHREGRSTGEAQE